MKKKRSKKKEREREKETFPTSACEALLLDKKMEWIKKLDRKLDGTALAKARDAAVRGVKKFALNESELEIATEEATNGEPWGPHGTAMAGEQRRVARWRKKKRGDDGDGDGNGVPELRHQQQQLSQRGQ